MSDSAITIENLSKCYRIGLKEQLNETLGGAIGSWLKSPVSNLGQLRRLTRFDTHDSTDVIWALSDITFNVNEGEVVGIIGGNGAGKSTLLKILSRIVAPTSGRARIRGRVASLLEVGTGFHNELTGRENVYLNGAVLGMSRLEIDRKFDAIVTFADVEKFLDTPVKRYSSGMKVRLAFAVAAHLDPEILLVDEVLAVGDAAFQNKCIGKMNEVAKSGRTVLFVSHNMGAVSALCDYAILIDMGKIRMIDETALVVTEYLRNGAGLAGRVDVVTNATGGEKSFCFHSARLLDRQGMEINQTTLAEGISVEIEYSLNEPMQRLIVVVELWDGNGICVLSSSDVDQDCSPHLEKRMPGRYVATCAIPGTFLRPGRYYITVGASVPRVHRLGVIPSQLAFDVLDVGNICTKVGQGRRGVIAPILEWQTSERDRSYQ